MNRLTNLEQAQPAVIRAWLTVLQEWWRPLLTAALLCAAILVLAPDNSIDRRLSDQLLVNRSQSVDPTIMIVEVDSGDVRRFGGPPIGRDGLAELLNHLADHRVKRVLIDSYLGEPLFAESDRQLAQAMARLGPKRLGLVTASTPNELPDPIFARHATIVDSRLTPDLDGWHRKIGWDDAWLGNNPATWLASGRTEPGSVALDLRIAHSDFERRSVRAMIASGDDLSSKTVLVSYSPLVAPSRAFLPKTVNANRGAVIAVGVQSVNQSYARLRSKGEFASMAIQLVAILIALLCGLAARSGRMLIGITAASAAVLFGACVSLGQQFATEVQPIRMLTGFLLMSNVTLVQRLKLVPMIGSFLRGDISPEEVWAWRSHEQSANPALLLSFDGRIKRFNSAATWLVDRHGDKLARSCLPQLGVKAESLSLADPDGVERIFSAEWPNAHAPIVILRDVTEAESEALVLRKQLMTDELTGLANRRGFDQALQDASTSGQSYAVFFLDMNGFKAVNDSFGHDAGDELLVRSAQRLAACVRPSDVVARLGGDEFALLVNGAVDQVAARGLADKLAAAIAAPFDLDVTGGEVRVGVAVGYALSEEVGNDPSELLRGADKAMYRDKVRSKLKAAA